MAFLEVRFLGELTIEQDGASLPEVKSQKGKALLCYLAASGKEATRPFLAALFWPDMPESNALMNLRKTLQRLRPLQSHLIITRKRVAFNQEADYWADVIEFERGTAIPKDIPRLQEAVALYQGDFLNGFGLPDAPLFEEWALAQRARLREVALGALQRLVTHFREDGAFETAIAYARQLLNIEPWHEETHRRLMRLLALSGQRSAALAQYEICRQMLADELGVVPAAATVQLYEQIKIEEFDNVVAKRGGQGDGLPPHNLPPQLTPFVGREAELAQLQELLAQPDVHLITILGAGGIGKTRLALALAERMLSRQGGHKSHPYKHGAYFAPLARLETAELLLPAIAEVVHFSFRDGQDQREQLLRYLTNKSMLLVLDNFEHLLAGTALVDEILQRAPQIKIVITSRARVNRRSEQLFPIRGMAYPPRYDAAGRNDQLDLDQYSAVQLFVQCARRVQPDFALTADNQSDVLQICQLLQGMPLGIVLAASWLHALSPKAISRNMQQDMDFLATDMEDVPGRQRSLRAAFNHSWRLLSQREQEIFSQMSIFRGGFSRAAAQTITGATLRDLQALVNKSLLLLSPDRRYDVHELLRQFAAEKLSEREALETPALSGSTRLSKVEVGVRERHSIYYCDLLQRHTPNWHSANQRDTLADVTREANNIQVAWDWALQHEAWQRLHGAIDSWSSYHQWRGLRENGERFCQATCTTLERWATTNPADAAAGYLLWAKAMTWYGEFASSIKTAAQRIQQSLTLLAHTKLAEVDTGTIEAFAHLSLGWSLIEYNRQESRSHIERSLLMHEAFQVSWAIADSLRALGYLDWTGGDYVSALQRLETSLAVCQELGDQWEELHTTGRLSWLYMHLGRLEDSEQLRHRALNLSQQLNDRSSTASQMAALVYLVGWQGRFEEGQQWAEKSVIVSQEDGDLAAEGFAQLALGWSLMLDGQYAPARQALAGSLVLERAVNNRGVEATVHYALGCIALVQGDHDQAQTEFEESFRLYQVVQGDAYTFLALGSLGLIACYHGQLERSRHHFIELLTEGLKRRDFLWVLTALPGMSLFWLKREERERAIMVWAQGLCHPHIANSQFYEDVVGQVVRRETADLPPHIIEVAEENGRSQDIWRMAESLLIDLQSGQ
jgi:predicted ATPase/DNA-binding SARP family transcriptional activator/tetratricopeptide (TPR) repeat protein